MLILNEEHKQAIDAFGEQGFPEEICGFLIGSWVGEIKTVSRLLAIENNWAEEGDSEFADAGSDFSGESRKRRFKIPSEQFYLADKRAREAGETILGFYHSHPNHPALPSSYDLRLAQEIFPGFSYIIVSIIRGTATKMTSWVLRDDYTQFDEEEIRAPDASHEEK